MVIKNIFPIEKYWVNEKNNIGNQIGLEMTVENVAHDLIQFVENIIVDSVEAVFAMVALLEGQFYKRTACPSVYVTNATEM